MNADWVAVAVRGRGLSSRRLGRSGAHRLAQSGSLEEAVNALARTPYGREVRTGMSAVAAGHAVFATLLWHLRILAGWAPQRGAAAVRILAGGFEIANICNHLARIARRPSGPAFSLGALSGTWGAVERTGSAAAVRRALAASGWGDPGGDDLATIRMALSAVWARRVADAVPPAAGWAASSVALQLARAIAAGVPPAPSSAAARAVDATVGHGWQEAGNLHELVRRLPRRAAWVLDGITGADELWLGEARWWARLEADAARLYADPRPKLSGLVGVAGLLAADAWRTRAAVEVAARGGGELREVADVVA